MIQRDLIIDYDIIRGLPGDVAEKVQQLISKQKNWQPYGEPVRMKIDNCDVIIQSMVQYEK